jgi:hypothetical protein
MPERSHNQAYYLLQDVEGFGWPVFAFLLLRVINPLSYGPNLADRWRKIAFVGTIIASMCAVFLLLTDGSTILQIAEGHPLWGIVLTLSFIAGSLSMSLSWFANRNVDSQLARGVLDASVDRLQIRDSRPRVLAIASFVLLSAAAVWLINLAKAPIS